MSTFPLVAGFGLSHRTASLALRERLAFGADAQRRWYERVRDEWPGDEIPEVLLLSTCNRTECLIGGLVDLETAQSHLVRLLTEAHGVPEFEFAQALEVWTGRDVVLHLGRVAAGAESMVFGESEILGQLREALDRARAHGAAGPVLGALVEHALRAGRRVRRETAVGRCSASVASEALRAAGETLDLATSRVVVLGTGDVARTTAQLLARRTAKLEIVARGAREAEDLARAVGGTARAWHELSDALRDADVVFGTTAAPHALIGVELLRSIRSAESPPLTIVDLSMPRNVEAGVGSQPGVRLIDLEDLAARVEKNLAARRETLPEVEAIVATEAARFADWQRSHAVRPVLSAMHARGEAIRRAELARLEARLGALEPEALAAIEHFSRSLVTRLLHEPSRHLRENADSVSAARRLFGLEDRA